ncbi:hypothetical protein HDU98_001367 [Podochytrium sp. JEL0797]|nr:hypothetical protein HDU98_001367 [Podochytrium sp. JEL0797]
MHPAILASLTVTATALPGPQHAKIPIGGACDPPATHCEPGLHCIAKICRPVNGLGGTCGTDVNWPTCKPGLVCVNSSGGNVQSPPNTCQAAAVGLGGTCGVGVGLSCNPVTRVCVQ